MLLFPYYRHAGPDDSFARTQDIMEKRRLASGQLEDLKARQQQLQSELDQLTQSNEGSEQQISRLRKQMMDTRNQLAAIPSKITEPVETINPDPEPKALTHGVEFSILGISTKVKSFVIVVDMSGSMLQYENLMVQSVLEILSQLNETNQFAIVGYHGNPQPVLWSFPNGTNLLPAKRTWTWRLRLPSHWYVNSLVQHPPTSLCRPLWSTHPAPSY
jgi:hypothetical protein